MSLDDREIIGKARQRAALSAQNGSREAKSGTFGDLQHVKIYCERVLRDAQAAYEPWAQWEAINDLLGSREKRDALKTYPALTTIWNSFFQEALLSVARVTDPVQNNREAIQSKPVEELQYSLLGLAKVLDDTNLRERLASKQWALDLGYSQNHADSAFADNAKRINEFRALVPVHWHAPPDNPRLYSLRKILKPVRDNILAHSIGDPRALRPFIVDEVRELLKLSLSLATDMHFLFLGNAVSADHWMKVCRKHADHFWPVAFEGFVERHRKHQAERKAAEEELRLALTNAPRNRD